MLVQSLKIFFQRDLKKLKLEIELYQDEKKIWLTEKRIANSAGNLCLHLVGNLNTYIGAELGKTGYLRNRDLEFSQKNIPRIELVEKIEETMQVVEMTLGNMKEETLN